VRHRGPGDDNDGADDRRQWGTDELRDRGERLTKRFGDTRALAGVDIAAERGSGIAGLAAGLVVIVLYRPAGPAAPAPGGPDGEDGAAETGVARAAAAGPAR
jgi:hypothetical protein